MRRWNPAFASATRIALAISALLVSGALEAPARADVIRSDLPTLIEAPPHTRIYEWRDPDIKPRGVAIACHGLVLHGATYDVMARNLAAKGFIVIAADMRGYGRWCKTTRMSIPTGKNGNRLAESDDDEGSPNTIVESSLVEVGDDATTRDATAIEKEKVAATSSDADLTAGDTARSTATVKIETKERLPRVSYERSYQDVKELIRATRNAYPSLPLFIIGESLGAGMALHAAADMPGSIDGIVLSSPAIKRRLTVGPSVMKDVVCDMAAFVTNPTKEVDLIPYMRHLASNDPQIIQAMVTDPLVRKRLCVVDLVKTAALVHSNIRHARRVPDSVPVLVMQGDQDRIMRSNGVVVLINNMKTRDQTVKWFKGKGHLLLETPYILPETMTIVSDWLIDHSQKANLVRAEVHGHDHIEAE